MTLPRFLDLPDTVAPDYQGGSLLNLMASLRARFGDRHAVAVRLRDEAALPLADARVVVLLVIDGLGARDLAARGQGGFLARHLARTLTTVFPATTASAVTTTLTGLSPAEHGLTGWYIRDDRFGGVLAPLPMVRRDRQPLTGWWRMPRLFPYPSLFQRLDVRSVMVAPESILGSPFNMRHSRGVARRYAYQDLAGLEAQLVQAVGDLGSLEGFVYAYHADYDALAHRFGIASPECDAQFAALDALIDRLRARLAGSDALLLVTADHGFIDSPPERQCDIAAEGALQGYLDGPLWGERRVAYCRVKAGHQARFEAEATARLDGRFHVVPSARLIDAGVFGPAGKPSRRLAERVGDFALIGREDWTLYDWLPNEKRFPMLGVHAGVSEDEMLIPLVAIPC
ncbi:alkaline phosphatase family protein [Denitromonas iodatirespirans]|uniref:Alkaline phosphatase family protein n=1 Tax=Denitromonas iodatirespirans TaxID=2795389 RepID=A0A944HCR2_DENI1|nr:alkaline phosphatase family protein [Denitromonas iodatirespirans]MBT0961406.1 alkaline phosphatase family protein [Denitromonas iodatirespirans]